MCIQAISDMNDSGATLEKGKSNVGPIEKSTESKYALFAN